MDKERVKLLNRQGFFSKLRFHHSASDIASVYRFVLRYKPQNLAMMLVFAAILTVAVGPRSPILPGPSECNSPLQSGDVLVL